MTSSLLKLSVGGGADFEVLSFQGHEALSTPFEHQVVFRAKEDLDPAATLGATAEVTVIAADGAERPFHGHVSRMVREHVDAASGSYRFRLTLVPWFALLQHTRDCRIFQEKSVLDIFNELAAEYGFGGDLEASVRGGQDVLTYCVQYRESAFQFISRLLEECGIFYWFRQEGGRHVMVLGDSTAAYVDCSPKKLTFSPANLPSDHLWRWEHQYRFVPGKAALRDHNSMTPSTELHKSLESVLELNAAKYEIYEYPGRFAATPAGESATQSVMEAEEAGFSVSLGNGNARSLAVAGKVELDDTFGDAGALASDREFVVTSIHHAATGQPPAGASGYECSFECIPAATPWRPRRSTPRPVIPGPQTAIVTGPDGAEIHCDEHARVKVQFRWDRKGANDDQTTCWIPVVQNGGYTSLFLPRIGTEVVVEFFDGDPDRPVITGRLYHPEELPPYTAEEMKTVSGFKSRSIGSTSRDDANEIRFDDKAGEETFFFQAQKDMVVKTKHDRTTTIGNNETKSVKVDSTLTVEEGNELITIKKGDRDVMIEKGNLTYSVGEGNHSVVVEKGDDTLKVSQGNRSVEISMGDDTLAIKMGNHTTKVDLGKSALEAMQGIELKVGGSSIKVDQAGVTIKGMIVKVEGQAMTQVKGLMLQLSGDAMAQLKGGVTMIG